MNRQAIVVGISKYPSGSDFDDKDALKAFSESAEAIAKLLEDHGEFKVTRLPEAISHSESSGTSRLTVSQAKEVNKKLLRNELDNLFAISSESGPDTALFYFCGHGYVEQRGKINKGYLVTSDFNSFTENYGLSMQDLHEILFNSPVKEKIVWLDCCYSGSLLQERLSSMLSGQQEEQGYKYCYITASRDNQLAFKELAGNYGVLTKILLNGLDPERHPEGKWVESLDLVNFINQEFKTNEALKTIPQNSLFRYSTMPISLVRGKRKPKKSFAHQQQFNEVSSIDERVQYVSLLPASIAGIKKITSSLEKLENWCLEASEAGYLNDQERSNTSMITLKRLFNYAIKILESLPKDSSDNYSKELFFFAYQLLIIFYFEAVRKFKIQLDDDPTVKRLCKGDYIVRDNFINICFKLKLNVKDIVDPEFLDVNIFAVDNVLVRCKPIIEHLCGTMRILGMHEPISLSQIYTNINVLQKITRERNLEIENIWVDSKAENFNRFDLNKVVEKTLLGQNVVKLNPKLIVFGKPGSGKTTFLKYLAIQCYESKIEKGKYDDARVPCFISIREFSENGQQDLIEFVEKIFSKLKITRVEVEQLLKYGKFLFLLDGLDEVKQDDIDRVINKIKTFSEQYYKNNFIISCRLAATEYVFDKFAEVEIADFAENEIENFVRQWFKNDPVKGENFIERIRNREPIKELASNPLLLTLLCLEFEDVGDFSENRSEIYARGIAALLSKWDASRNIQRDKIYPTITVLRKEDLLSQIAMSTFLRNEYFFKQERILEDIGKYIRTLPGIKRNKPDLVDSSEKVLTSIESQHGLLVKRAKKIYSFSHLTFHEYFTAREIVRGGNKNSLEHLVLFINDKRWHEVFLLTAGMLTNADELLKLMKKTVDNIVAERQEFQNFLSWLNEKSRSVNAPYEFTVIKAFYFNICLNVYFNAYLFSNIIEPDFQLVSKISKHNSFALSSDLIVDLTLIHILSLCSIIINIARGKRLRETTYDLTDIQQFVDKLVSELNNILNVDSTVDITNEELRQVLVKISNQIPIKNIRDYRNNQLRELQWAVDLEPNKERLRNLMMTDRNIRVNWQFDKPHMKKLKEYYDANLLLVECINGESVVTPEVRQNIESTLLLPIDEIKK